MLNIQKEIKTKEIEFMLHAQGTIEQKRNLFGSLKRAKSASVAVWVLKIPMLDKYKYNNWTSVPLSDLYEDISTLADSMNTTHFPKKTNFNTLNNLVKLLQSGNSPIINTITSTTRSFNPIIFTPEYVDVINFFWRLKVEGHYESVAKNTANVAENASKAQHNIYGVNDGGVDHYIIYNNERYATDYKHLILDFATLKSLIIHKPNPLFCIRALGFAQLIDKNTGGFTSEFLSFLMNHNMVGTLITESNQMQLFVKQLL